MENFRKLVQKIHVTYPHFCNQPEHLHDDPCINISEAKNGERYGTVVTCDFHYGFTLWNGKLCEKLNFDKNIQWRTCYQAIGCGEPYARALSQEDVIQKLKTLGEKAEHLANLEDIPGINDSPEKK